MATLVLIVQIVVSFLVAFFFGSKLPVIIGGAFGKTFGPVHHIVTDNSLGWTIFLILGHWIVPVLAGTIIVAVYLITSGVVVWWLVSGIAGHLLGQVTLARWLSDI